MMKLLFAIAACVLVGFGGEVLGDAGLVDQAQDTRLLRHHHRRPGHRPTRKPVGPPKDFYDVTFDINDWKTVKMCVKPNPDCDTGMPPSWGEATSELMVINGTNATLNGWYICINPLNKQTTNATWSVEPNGESWNPYPMFKYVKEWGWGTIGMCFPGNILSCSGEPCPAKYAKYCNMEYFERLAYPQDYLTYLKGMNISYSHQCVVKYSPFKNTPSTHQRR